MKMLDLFCGRFGWSRAFVGRGWECVGVDLTAPPEIPGGCTFLKMDVLTITPEWIAEQGFDFICASSPCEQFSVHGMKHFHPNPPYPELGLRLFNHTRMLCEMSGLPYVMENVRAAQQFVGNAVHHCGPFYLWGSGVPPLMSQGVKKGLSHGSTPELMAMSPTDRRAARRAFGMIRTSSRSKERKEITAANATIPPELSTAVVDYAERIIEQREVAA
jgi:hypothetical protein